MRLLKSRKGSIPMSIDRMSGLAKALKKRSSDATWSAFVSELSKLAVSDDEALEAARLLSESRKSRLKRYTQSGVIGATTTPVVRYTAELAAAAASPKHQRVNALREATRKAFSRPEIAKHVTGGALGGGVIQGVRENVGLSQARRTYENYLKEHGA
jgi:hypothetical protein